jgi:hypothetical protein
MKKFLSNLLGIKPKELKLYKLEFKLAFPTENNAIMVENTVFKVTIMAVSRAEAESKLLTFAKARLQVKVKNLKED